MTATTATRHAQNPRIARISGVSALYGGFTTAAIIVLCVALVPLGASATDWRTQNRQMRNDQRTYNRHQRLQKQTDNFLNGLRSRRNGSGGTYSGGGSYYNWQPPERKRPTGANNCRWLQRLARSPRIDFRSLQDALAPAMVGYIQVKWNGMWLTDRVDAYRGFCGFTPQVHARLRDAADTRKRRSARKRGPRKCYKYRVERISARATRSIPYEIPCASKRRAAPVSSKQTSKQTSKQIWANARKNADRQRKQAEVAHAVRAATGNYKSRGEAQRAKQVQAWRNAYFMAYGKYPPPGARPPR